MENRIKIELDNVQETLLLPLWGRAVEAKKEHPRLTDKLAVEIIGKLDYDFSTISQNISSLIQYAWIARSLHTDNAIGQFLKKYPEGTIVNIGCGLDTTFDRIDNGKVLYYDLDLPDVIELRSRFVPGHPRRKSISCSFLDTKWFDALEIRDNVFFFATGVFYYFTEEQIKGFLLAVADRFPGCEMLFDWASPLGVRMSNKKVIEGGGMSETAVLKWGIDSAKILEAWDPRIRLIRQYPLFKKMKKGHPFKMRYGLWLSDRLKIMSMAHLQIKI